MNDHVLITGGSRGIGAARSFPLARLSRLTRVSCAFALFVVGF